VILHRTPWQPPVAVSGQGIYITLEDGREVIDAVGGAAVACIGNGHPVVREAIKEQVDKLACEYPSYCAMGLGLTDSPTTLDVYNMQLSNEPAEELARLLIDSGKGAFELCGFFAGGASCPYLVDMIDDSRNACLGSEAMEGVIKLARQVFPILGILTVLYLTIIWSFQYWYEQKQPQRKFFISRHLSYHGNTVATLSLSGHPSRREPYEEILQHENFHKVSPAYAKRFQRPEETEEQYVERLRRELEDKFLELGPDTVIGCKCFHVLKS
jgi:E3 ubiquitin-protein ligase TRIP12